jgi:membrane associated rhomboid family serine protease
MLALYFLGRYLCMFIGDKWFLIVYFTGGIIGSFFFILLGPQYATVVGASGAIFAVGGALAITVPQMKVIMFPIPIPMPLWVAIIGGFIIMSLLPGVAWQAHLGGLVTGLAIGYYLRRKGPRRIIL